MPCNVKPSTIFTGDNLPVLRGITSNSIDLIYLDPPFNSNVNYAAPIGSEAAGVEFKDTWSLDDIKTEWHGEIADSNYPLYCVLQTAREAHSKSMGAYLIYMAIRLIETQRILKSTGSIYLHCDTTAAHYIKLIMDAVFDRKNFRNEIVWKRTNSPKAQSKAFGKQHDLILFYTKSDSFTFAKTYRIHDKESLKAFCKEDDVGKFQTVPIVARGTQIYGDRKKFDFHGIEDYWLYKKETLNEWWDKGLIHVSSRGKYRKKEYLKNSKGTLVSDLFVDDGVKPLQGKKGENTKFPTQKPIALLERIIKASSNKGDLILDPFCGCATACVAAENLQRKWIGIDISSKASDLIKSRFKKELDLFNPKIIHRTDIPVRKGKPSPDIKHILYGKQEGKCNGCNIHFQFRNLTKDHIIPTNKGGSNTDDNLQLLCGSCNSIKGDKDMAHLKTRLKEVA